MMIICLLSASLICQIPSELFQIRKAHKYIMAASRYHKHPVAHQCQQQEAVLRSFFHMSPVLENYLYHDDISFSPNGTTFVVIAGSQDIALFHTEGCRALDVIANRKYRCTHCSFHPTKNLLYVNSKSQTDHAARLVNIETHGFDRYFIGHTGQITSLAPISSGLITSSEDRSVRIWDESQKNPVFKLDLEIASNIAVHPNGNCLAVASPTQFDLFDIRKMDSGRVTGTRLGYDTELFPHFGMRGRTVCLVGKGIANEYNLSDLSIILAIESVGRERVPGFCYSPDEAFLLVGTQENSIVVVNAEKGTLVTVLAGHETPISAISYSPAFHHLVSTANDCLFWTVDMSTYNSLMAPRVPFGG
jgi:WD40 repeat protein